MRRYTIPLSVYIPADPCVLPDAMKKILCKTDTLTHKHYTDGDRDQMWAEMVNLNAPVTIFNDEYNMDHLF